MSAVKELIGQLELEDEVRREEREKETEEQANKYKKMQNEVDYFKDETTKYMNTIIKNLEQLLANKSSIEKILEQTDDLVGLPIPYKHHEAAVDLVSKITEFVSNASSYLNTSNVVSPNEIHEDLINITENVAVDLKECHTEVAQAQAFYLNTKLLKNMVDDSSDNEAHKLDNSNYGTILE